MTPSAVERAPARIVIPDGPQFDYLSGDADEAFGVVALRDEDFDRVAPIWVDYPEDPFFRFVSSDRVVAFDDVDLVVVGGQASKVLASFTRTRCSTQGDSFIRVSYSSLVGSFTACLEFYRTSGGSGLLGICRRRGDPIHFHAFARRFAELLVLAVPGARLL